MKPEFDESRVHETAYRDELGTHTTDCRPRPMSTGSAAALVEPAPTLVAVVTLPRALAQEALDVGDQLVPLG